MPGLNIVSVIGQFHFLWKFLNFSNTSILRVMFAKYFKKYFSNANREK